MHQPIVLPSNAPPLGGDNGVYQASRVLQEHSGNRQQYDYHGSSAYERKYASAALAENAWPAHQQHHQQQIFQTAAQFYHPHLQYRQSSLTYAQANHRRTRFYADDEERITRQAKNLFQRFQASAAYKKYRGRQQKDDKAQDQKWPDQLEEAFFRALVKYPPMGRHKRMHKQKQRGRNELIADHIEELTGEARSRKQVSSHIQVLKPFVEHDPQIMQWLSKEDMTGHPGGRHFSGQHGSGYMSGRRMSTYRPSPQSGGAARGSLLTQQPQLDLNSIRQLKHSLDIFEPTKFEMFVQRKYAVSDNEVMEQRLHTYTQSLDQPRGPDSIVPDWQTFYEKYPDLAQMHKEKELDCNVLVAEASIGFPTEEFKNKTGIELGISYICSSRHLNSSTRVRCRNSFWENGNFLNDQNNASGVFDVPFQREAGDDRSVAPLIKFGSNFWATRLSALGVKLKKRTETGGTVQEEVRGSLRNITAIQEIVVSSGNNHERILVILWRFRLSSVTVGRASWCKLVFPQTTTSEYPEPKTGHAGSMCEYNGQYIDIPAVSQVPPTLQSPFEYDGSSGSGSALSSATWPTSISDGSVHAPNDNDFTADTAFDFGAGDMNLNIDPNFDFSNFDSSAFNFDAATADFAQDPALEQYSQQWADSYTSVFDTQAPLSAVSADSTFAVSQAQMEEHSQSYNSYDPTFDQQQSYDGVHDPQAYAGGSQDAHTYTAEHSQQIYSAGQEFKVYATSHDQQAYGGAGQEAFKQEDDALAALADASYLAQSLPSREGQ